MMQLQAREHVLADFTRIAPELPGANLPWLVRGRNEALERFAQQGYPTQRDEEWKYTSVAAIEKGAFAALAGAPGDDVSGLLGSLAMDAQSGHLLVFVNGFHASGLSRIGKLPSGAVLGSIAEALQRTPDRLQPYLTDTASQTVFGALNTAFMADGAWLHVPRGVEIDEPIHLLFINTASGAAIHPRNVLVAEEGARAIVIEHHAGAGDTAYFNNVVTQIYAAGNAAVEHYKLQQESARAFHIAGIHAQQQQASRLESHSVTLGAALARNDITTRFHAAGCEATLNGLYLIGARQHADNHTCIDHAAPHGTSHEYYRGVLDGAARAVFNGKVIVRPGAQKTNARQANHNLLLSRDAEIDTKPQLEIHADDVQCAHGATIGQLDDTQLFYLRSRGIEEAMARNLLVHAFAHDVIERIRVQSLRSRLEQILFARLPQGDLIRELT
jgi:Fe-S cluster assembly protein SufD